MKINANLAAALKSPVEFTPETAIFPLPVSSDRKPAHFDVKAATERVLWLLPTDAPFIQPKHIADALGLSDRRVHDYCASCRELRAWRGSYRFFTDDRDHMEKLRAVICLALWSMHKLPPKLRCH